MIAPLAAEPSGSGAVDVIAHTIGTDFRPAPRRDMSKIVHRDTW